MSTERFNRLGQSTVPRLGAKIFPDRMDIVSDAASAGTGGGRIKTGNTKVYENVPCSCALPRGGGGDSRGETAATLKSKQEYRIRFPVYLQEGGETGNRINIDPDTHLLVVRARDLEPEKTFRVVAVGDSSGVLFDAVCVKEG